jgi:protein disulfide-isomerase
MRLLRVSFLLALFASVLAIPVETNSEEVLDEAEEDVVQPTVFNGLEVPPLTQIQGAKFNVTVKDGWWLVKHHS